MSRVLRGGCVLPALLALVLPAAVLLTLVLSASAARADGGGTGAKPVVALSPATAAPGGTTVVTGTGWPAGALLTVLLCGQNALSGTDSCANDSGKALTTGPAGTFSVQLPVVKPPKPCPCVIHTTTVTGAHQTVDTPFPVIGVDNVPIVPTPGKLYALTESLGGSSGLMNWFGAPAHRTLRVVVANVGNGVITDPVFRIASSHSVYAPAWQDFPWTGTIRPGARQEIDVPVDFASGAHGRYALELDYGGTQLTTQPLTLPRAWGVILFWVLLCVVIPVGLFRIGLAVVDRVRPDLTLGRAQRRAEERRAKLGRRRAGAPAPSSTGLQPLPPLPKSVTQGRPAGPEGSEGWDTLVLPPLPTDPPRAAHRPLAPTLPWFAPGTVPLTVQDRTPGPLHSTTSKGT